MLSANSVYTPSISPSQQKNYKYSAKKLVGISAIQDFNRQTLYRQLHLTHDFIRSEIEGKFASEGSPIAGFGKITSDFLSAFLSFIQKRYPRYHGQRVNICQKKIADFMSVSPQTVGQRMRELAEYGLRIDLRGDPNDPLYKEYKGNSGKTRQYILDFSGLFETIFPLIQKKKLRYYYRNNSKNKPPKSESAVDKQKEKPVENKGIIDPNATKKSTSYVIINNYNTIRKNISSFFSNDAQKPSTPPPNPSGTDAYELTNDPDNGAFSDLFDRNMKNHFLSLSSEDQELFLTFKRNQILYYMRRYSGYSTRQERANRGFLVLKELAMAVNQPIKCR